MTIQTKAKIAQSIADEIDDLLGKLNEKLERAGENGLDVDITFTEPLTLLNLGKAPDKIPAKLSAKVSIDPRNVI